MQRQDAKPNLDIKLYRNLSDSFALTSYIHRTDRQWTQTNELTDMQHSENHSLCQCMYESKNAYRIFYNES